MHVAQRHSTAIPLCSSVFSVVTNVLRGDQPGTQHFGHASLCGKVVFGVHRIGGFGIEQHLCYPDGCRCHFAFVLTINMPVILRGHAVHDLIRQSCYDHC